MKIAALLIQIGRATTGCNEKQYYLLFSFLDLNNSIKSFIQQSVVAIRWERSSFFLCRLWQSVSYLKI